MAKRRLFISHSSGNRVDPATGTTEASDENLALLGAVCRALDGRGYEVLVDRGRQFDEGSGLFEGLAPGVDWDRRINEWMAECHAAVLLFSEAATLSDWVAKEAAILSWRRELDDEFVLVPVLLDGMTAESLVAWLGGALRVEKSQCIAPGAGAAAIADGVHVALGGPEAGGSTPLDGLAGVIEEILLKDRQGYSASLETVWDALPAAGKPAFSASIKARFARSLARLLVRDREQTLSCLLELLDGLHPRMEARLALELLSYLASLWVDPRAAGGVAAARRDGRPVALNGNYVEDFTAQRYLERAWPMTNRWKLIVPAVARSAADVQRALRDEFVPKARRRRALSDADLDRRIADFGAPIVVLVPPVGEPPAIESPGLVASLCADANYRNVVFLLAAGAREPVPIPPGTTLLSPPLDTDLERRMYDEYDKVDAFIEDHLR